MTKSEFLLKLLLLGFEAKRGNRYIFEDLKVRFKPLRGGGNLTLLFRKYTVMRANTSDDLNSVYESVLNELGITNEHVEGELKTSNG